jgi:hypothetical protein
MVLFMTMTRAIAVPYDSDDQVNAVDIVASVHGRYSSMFLWTVIDMELVRGIRAVGTMRGYTGVTTSECEKALFAVAHHDEPHLSLQTLMEAIVDVAHSAVAFCTRVPPRKGTVVGSGVQEFGIDAQAGMDVATLVYKYLSCEASQETRRMEKLRHRFAGDKHPAKDRTAEIKVTLQGIKKVWQCAVAREAFRQEVRWERVRAKLEKIKARTLETLAPGKRKSGGKCQKGGSRRSGPAAAKNGNLDSSEGETSSGVNSAQSGEGLSSGSDVEVLADSSRPRKK